MAYSGGDEATTAAAAELTARSRENVVPVDSSGSDSEYDGCADGGSGSRRVWMQVTQRSTEIRLGPAHQAVVPGCLPVSTPSPSLSGAHRPPTDATEGSDAKRHTAAVAGSVGVASGAPPQKRVKEDAA